MQYNLIYGDGVSDTVVRVWNEAYSALMLYNNGQILVLSTLAQITAAMAALETQAKAASSAVSSAGGSSGTVAATPVNAVEHTKYKVVASNGNVIKDGFTSVAAAQAYIDSLPAQVAKNYAARVVSYAKGLKAADTAHLGAMDEPWLGDEMFIKTANGSRLKRIEVGDSVIPADMTKTLMAFAGSPQKFLKDMMYDINAVGAGGNAPVSIDNRLIVQGNVTEDVLPVLQQMVQKQENTLFKNMQNWMNAAGYRSRVRGY
jgi:hypothetical protein